MRAVGRDDRCRADLRGSPLDGRAAPARERRAGRPGGRAHQVVGRLVAGHARLDSCRQMQSGAVLEVRGPPRLPHRQLAAQRAVGALAHRDADDVERAAHVVVRVQLERRARSPRPGARGRARSSERRTASAPPHALSPRGPAPPRRSRRGRRARASRAAAAGRRRSAGSRAGGSGRRSARPPRPHELSRLTPSAPSRSGIVAASRWRRCATAARSSAGSSSRSVACSRGTTSSGRAWPG